MTDLPTCDKCGEEMYGAEPPFVVTRESGSYNYWLCQICEQRILEALVFLEIPHFTSGLDGTVNINLIDL